MTSDSGAELAPNYRGEQGSVWFVGRRRRGWALSPQPQHLTCRAAVWPPQGAAQRHSQLSQHLPLLARLERELLRLFPGDAGSWDCCSQAASVSVPAQPCQPAITLLVGILQGIRDLGRGSLLLTHCVYRGAVSQCAATRGGPREVRHRPGEADKTGRIGAEKGNCRIPKSIHQGVPFPKGARSSPCHVTPRERVRGQWG